MPWKHMGKIFYIMGKSASGQGSYLRKTDAAYRTESEKNGFIYNTSYT